MSQDTTGHILWPYDHPQLRLPRDPDECQGCGSYDTFKTYDKKLVCRCCWHVEGLD